MPFTCVSLVCLLLFCACTSTPGQSASSVAPEELFIEGSIEAELDDSSRSYDYRLLRPIEKAEDGPRPLLVFLHGMGERGSDNLSQL